MCQDFFKGYIYPNPHNILQNSRKRIGYLMSLKSGYVALATTLPRKKSKGKTYLYISSQAFTTKYREAFKIETC